MYILSGYSFLHNLMQSNYFHFLKKELLNGDWKADESTQRVNWNFTEMCLTFSTFQSLKGCWRSYFGHNSSKTEMCFFSLSELLPLTHRIRTNVMPRINLHAQHTLSAIPYFTFWYLLEKVSIPKDHFCGPNIFRYITFFSPWYSPYIIQKL